MITAEVKIMKGGEEVADASLSVPERLSDARWLGIDRLDCYYFPRVKLTNRVVWEVMAGTALGHFLDHSELCVRGDVEETVVRDLRYVHGRAEITKGRPSISTVLLVRVHAKDPVPEARWLTYLPSIYEEFLRGYGEPPKTA